MIDWYVELSDGAPEQFGKDDYLANVIDTATPFMKHFCKRLTEIEDWKLEDANKIFEEIIEEMPIMTACIYKEEFFIRYNKCTYIRLTDTTKQIYRNIKLEKLLITNE